MKTLDSYIEFIFDDMVQYENEVSKEFLGKKAYFQKNGDLWIDGIEEEVFEREHESVFIPNSRQWERMEEELRSHLDIIESSLENNIKRSKSILSEIEVLKNAFIDIWTVDKLHFKQEYLEGKRIDLESRNLTMNKALNMLAMDLANVHHYNNIESRIEELEDINPQNALVKNQEKKTKKLETIIRDKNMVLDYLERLKNGEPEVKAQNNSMKLFEIKEKTFKTAVSENIEIVRKFKEKNNL